MTSFAARLSEYDLHLESPADEFLTAVALSLKKPEDFLLDKCEELLEDVDSVEHLQLFGFQEFRDCGLSPLVSKALVNGIESLGDAPASSGKKSKKAGGKKTKKSKKASKKSKKASKKSAKKDAAEEPPAPSKGKGKKGKAAAKKGKKGKKGKKAKPAPVVEEESVKKESSPAPSSAEEPAPAPKTKKSKSKKKSKAAAKKKAPTTTESSSESEDVDPLNHKIALVQDSWKLVQPISTTASELFYQQLFRLDPSLRPLFKGDIITQQIKLMEMLDSIIEGLGNLGEIVPSVQELAIRHVSYNVTPAMYATVGKSLIWTLEQGLGDKFNDELREAWGTVLGILVETMLNAAEPFMEGKAAS